VRPYAKQSYQAWYTLRSRTVASRVVARATGTTMSFHDYERIQERLRSVSDPIGFLVNLFAPVGFAGAWSG
jgi:hypothetical protein